jgi:hypothetical protein
LLRNADETLSLTLITDSDEDRKVLIELLDQIIATRGTQQYRSALHSEADFDELAAEQFFRLSPFAEISQGASLLAKNSCLAQRRGPGDGHLGSRRLFSEPVSIRVSGPEAAQ